VGTGVCISLLLAAFAYLRIKILKKDDDDQEAGFQLSTKVVLPPPSKLNGGDSKHPDRAYDIAPAGRMNNPYELPTDPLNSGDYDSPSQALKGFTTSLAGPGSRSDHLIPPGGAYERVPGIYGSAPGTYDTVPNGHANATSNPYENPTDALKLGNYDSASQRFHGFTTSLAETDDPNHPR
jgi:hypothetical protein